MPESVQAAILELCKSGKGVLELKDPTTNAVVGRLEFDENGMSKTIEEQVFIVKHLERILTFSKKNVNIFFAEIPIDQINKETKLIEHIDAG